MRKTPAEPAPDLLGAEDAPAGPQGRPPRLPQPSPVIPLGVLGKNLVFLDRLQQIQVEPPRSCSKGELALWFGVDWLVEHFPQYPKGWKPGDPEPDDFHQGKVQMALVEDCQARKIFNPQGKVLGRGAHRPQADESKLVLHMGERVLIASSDRQVQRAPAGMVEIGGKDVFFPAADALPPPADRAAPRDHADELHSLLFRWNWKEPEASTRLLLGWVAQAMICGALDWRAHVWLHGPTASGKSYLQRLIRAILDGWSLNTADTSEAGVRQMLGNDTLAVSVDEAEKHDNPERLQGLLNLIKKASSGDEIIRGGADHKATSFTAQSCFLLSSVLHATMRGEDRNRIALLAMRALPEKVEALDLDFVRWRKMGREMHRRMIEQWPRFDRTLWCYRSRIGSQGFTGRWQDTYGTLLACADLLLYDLAPDQAEESALELGWARVNQAIIDVLPMMQRGRVEAADDTERCVAHLLSQSIPGERGSAPEMIGTWLSRAIEPVMDDVTGQEQINWVARERLKTFGLRVMRLENRRTGPGGVLRECLDDALVGEEGWRTGYLALAYPSHVGLQQLWARTEWIGDGYKQSLMKIDGVVTGKKVRFNPAGSDNALLVPLRAFRGEEG